MVLLLTGLLCPNHGQIFLNGLPSTDYDPEALRHCFAVAPQNPSLFTGTIRDNLLLGRMDATETQMWQALHVVELDEFATSLPGGLDCPLGEAGLTLSGGEARRLSIARALLRDAPVLILDEPGEGLDYQTEKTMLKAIVSALAGRSLLLITHLKAGLDLMDEVVQLVSQHRKNAATPADR